MFRTRVKTFNFKVIFTAFWYVIKKYSLPVSVCPIIKVHRVLYHDWNVVAGIQILIFTHFNIINKNPEAKSALLLH